MIGMLMFAAIVGWLIHGRSGALVGMSGILGITGLVLLAGGEMGLAGGWVGGRPLGVVLLILAAVLAALVW